VKQSAKLTWIEILIVLVIVLIILRFVFAGVLLSYEKRLFASLGIGEGARLLLLAPVAAGLFYLSYRRGRYSERVPSWLLVAGICVIVLLAGAIPWWLKA
jgi:preprotein translocase subunit SecY